MQFHTGKFSYFCDICQKGFNHVTNFTNHKRAHEGIKYHCQYCSKPFAKKIGLDYHLSQHTGEYRFKCEKCGQGFNEKPKFQKHVDLHQ